MKEVDCDRPKEFYKLAEGERMALLQWCERFRPTKTFNNSYSSYGLKHLFEATQGGFYVTNGMLKGAMLLTGFKIEQPYHSNWHFNISNKSILEIQRDLIRNPI